MFSTRLLTRLSTCGQMVSMGQVYPFAYNMAVILHTLWFCMTTVFYWALGLRSNDFNFYMMGKKYTMSFLFAILVLCNSVESSKITKLF